MELQWTKDGIVFEKEENDLDHLAFLFVEALHQQTIRYVIVSGYVAILFGRNRASEDIDILVDKVPYPQWKNLWDALSTKLFCLNTDDVHEAYEEYLQNEVGLRFAFPGSFAPNVEVKFANKDLDFISLDQQTTVVVNGHRLSIAPFEVQIPFKPFLGTEKDIEDARFLYTLFHNHIQKNTMDEIMRKLNIPKEIQVKLR